MILLAGIHGVGKTTLCKEIEKHLNINCYSASKLIENALLKPMPKNKLIKDIQINQIALINEIEKIRINTNNKFMLEGHFCILNKKQVVTTIYKSVFKELNIDYIIILAQNKRILSKRNKFINPCLNSNNFLKEFQEKEIQYGKYVSNYLKVPIKVFYNYKNCFSYIKHLRNRGIV